MTLTLDQGTELCRLLADGSRLRLLALLEAEALSVAELTEITGLAQSRVSTHLAKLKRAGLVQDQRQGNAALYSLRHEGAEAATGLWALLRGQVDDARLRLDRERASEVVRARKQGQTWAETVAGRMELHYSPGRTWEATARALIGLLRLGRVLDLASGDGVHAELIASQAEQVTCVDISPTVIAAARRRLAKVANVDFHQGDMHRLPFADASFDHVLALHALAYSADPAALFAEISRLLRPGGRVVIAALNRHRHEEAMRAYDHLNLGITPRALQAALLKAGLSVERCTLAARETRPPYFEVITALARRG
ncbi:MAG TPA: metalloregulator ArsR/SmtB family transcription factor [Nevskiaceae bacterium]|nr:metalloregulator ArsR/SmtB family transcription factor [Nevskiaceae bacterium]